MIIKAKPPIDETLPVEEVAKQLRTERRTI